MDETDLISYYHNKAKEWIVTPKFQNVLIEDDEILDLDSISLSSNEDTWLYSSNNKSFTDSMSDNYEKILDNEKLNKKCNIQREIESFDYDNRKSTFVNNGASVFSPDSPLLCIDDFQHNSFLNSFDAMTDSALDDLLKTPSYAKSKTNFLKKVLSTSTNRSGVEDSNMFIKPKTDCNSLKNEDTHTSTDFNTYTFKKPFKESVEKSYILHSVENKLFTINNVDGNDLRSAQNREMKKVNDTWKGSGDADVHDSDPVEEKKCLSSLKNVRATPIKPYCQKLSQIEKDALRHAELKAFENDENAFKKELPLSHSTPCLDKNVNRAAASKKPIALCQPSPVLLNRYLKYNKVEEKNNSCLPKRRTSNEYTKEEMNDKCDKPDRNEMNVSYIKYSPSDENVNLPNINENESPVKSVLNGTYSKSDDVLNSPFHGAGDERLNSTYDLIEDDIKSSTSESSLSSASNKYPLSIKEVEKMAELQELSLKKHIHSSYYAGSSKSSEVSSSNESISGFGQLSSSNEGQMNANTLRSANSGKSLRNQSLMYLRGANNATLNSKSAGSYNRSGLRLELQPTATQNTVVKQHMSANNIPKLSNMFKNKLSLHNGVTNSKKESNAKISTVVPKCSVDSAVNEEGEFVSIKEIKSRDNIEVKASSNIKSATAAGPVSHIPRPSSRIPMLRTSTSCNRYSQSK